MAREVITLVTQIPCNSITKKQNQTLNIRANYTYQGPAKTARLGAVVTQEGVSEFDEVASTRKEVYVDLPESLTPSTLYSNITGLPLSGCSPKSGYGVKVYALDIDGKPEWGAKKVLTVESVIPAPQINVTSLSLS